MKCFLFSCVYRDLVMEFKYLVAQSSNSVILDAATTTSLTVEELKTALAAVSVTRISGDFYAQYVYNGDVNLLVQKKDLCMVVVEQRVAARFYAEFESAITLAWTAADSSETPYSTLLLLEWYTTSIMSKYN